MGAGEGLARTACTVLVARFQKTGLISGASRPCLGLAPDRELAGPRLRRHFRSGLRARCGRTGRGRCCACAALGEGEMPPRVRAASWRRRASG